MKAFQANLAKLEGSDTQVLGVSIDSPFANHAFAEKESITFPLLGDMEGKVITDYGLMNQVKIQGATVPSARRATFLIDKDGKIAHITDTPSADTHLAEMKDAVEKLHKG